MWELDVSGEDSYGLYYLKISGIGETVPRLDSAEIKKRERQPMGEVG